MNNVIYESTVTSIGELVPSFIAEGMLVFFGEEAPEELHSFCVLHRNEYSQGEIALGDVISIDDHSFEILALGSVASDHLMRYGHLNLKANGKVFAELPNDVCVAQLPLPTVSVGSKLKIARN